MTRSNVFTLLPYTSVFQFHLSNTSKTPQSFSFYTSLQALYLSIPTFSMNILFTFSNYFTGLICTFMFPKYPCSHACTCLNSVHGLSPTAPAEFFICVLKLSSHHSKSNYFLSTIFTMTCLSYLVNVVAQRSFLNVMTTDQRFP